MRTFDKQPSPPGDQVNTLLCEWVLTSGDPGDDGFGGTSHLLGYVNDISS